ncbi:MAG: hypothetical protein KAG18_04725 [Sinobacterium sp.]|nr:hypothetical protein [Sinobacterium sp.]
MENTNSLSDDYQHSHINLEGFSNKAECIVFIGQLMKDVADMISTQSIALDDDLFLALQEMSAELIELAEQLLVTFNSAYLKSEVKADADLSGLRIWIQSFAHINDSFSQDQRISSLKQVVNKMIKSQSKLLQ